uniref:Alternative protein KIAA0922 n=1 Tax=Homo sapiens TaxID=9606 RepID=L0R4Z7_HUMAN|nr:alternative protein KIAA0922 [Homo sapiens]
MPKLQAVYLLPRERQKVTTRSLRRNVWTSSAPIPALTVGAPLAACVPAGAAGGAGAAPAAPTGIRSPWWTPSTSCRPETVFHKMIFLLKLPSP